MVEYPRATDFQGAVPIGTWGSSLVPVYDVPSMHSLNQLVGYVKHINAGNGTVLYRGQCKLYERVAPSIKHDLVHEDEDRIRLIESINAVLSDDPCKHFFGLKNREIAGWELYQKLVVEAALQHYGAKTYCVDFVDNHWTALWFGLYEWDKDSRKYSLRINTFQGEEPSIIQKSDYIRKKAYPSEPTIDTITLEERIVLDLRDHAKNAPISFEELVNRNKKKRFAMELKKWKAACQKVKYDNDRIDSIEKTDHLFLFLYVADTNTSNLHGIYLGEKTYTIDLRKALPSTFLRPCSQHGWIVKGKESSYDFNKNIACVIRVNVDLAKEMLGNGMLLSQENFFPNEQIDQGYNVLLERQAGSRIASKYKTLLPENMITDFG